jgi:hypothetical protein
MFALRALSVNTKPHLPGGELLKIDPPAIIDGGELPVPATEAAEVLIAEAITTDVDVLNIVVNYTSDTDEDISVYEISVRRLGD